jgi:hypothetical protein
VRYWINAEDEDYDRELRRAELSGDPLPAALSPADRTAIGAMIAMQVIAFAALALLVIDWLRDWLCA